MYEKGDGLRSDHVLDGPGEFRAIVRDFGLEAALTCWANTHPVLSAIVGFVVGSVAIVLAAAFFVILGLKLAMPLVFASIGAEWPI